jgi:hypothetical protein
VVLVTFGHPWLRHSSHPERAVDMTDVVRVLELTVCTLRLSVRVFIPLPDVRKPKTPVLTFWTLVLESFENTFLYITVGQAALLAPGFWSPLCSSNPSIKMSVDVPDPGTWLVSHPGYLYLSLYLIMTL